jgi:tRNA threonylcarbamoyladenosine biosynthesis protein TsaB
MALILHIETATRQCSVALSYKGNLLYYQEIALDGYSHAEKLHVFIQEVMQHAQLSFAQLDAIAVSKGPGSYTGLRIGNSAAKGLCFALDIPLIALDTLAILAAQVQLENKEALVVPMLDARRMEVYSAMYDTQGNCMRTVQAEILDEDSYSTFKEQLYFVGDCQAKLQSVLQQPNFHFLPNIVYPSAKDMLAQSYTKFLKKDFEDVAYYEPFYLKDFVGTTPKKQL